ncbi:MAG TPA: two-component regulator propeller domain-containing protein [Candidatus Acidoferrales bacterium]|nr:two-component regulator propeller domain-containing protein [Candidatus Acidoferrales bacterium]
MIAVSTLIGALLSSYCLAEQLPLRHFTQADGLPGVAIHRIVADSKGYLWFCTNEGLTRYDGHAFVSYGAAQGLGDPNVQMIVEASNGFYWVGTAAGLFRLADRGLQKKAYTPPGDSNSAWITAGMAAGSLVWIGTRSGLYRFDTGTGVFQQIDLPGGTPQTAVTDILHDPQTGYWVATTSGLYRLRRDRTTRYSTNEGLPTNFITALGLDAEGNVWAGTDRGLCRIAAGASTPRIVERSYTAFDGLPGESIRVLLKRSDGSLWFGTDNGFGRMADIAARDVNKIRSFGRTQGLLDLDVQSMAEDRNGNLWIGTNFGAAARIARGGMVNYRMQDGLGSLKVVSILQDARGRLVVVTRSPGRLFANWFDGNRFHAERINAPEHFHSTHWLGLNQVLVQSRTGDWWCASEAGLLRFRAAKGTNLFAPGPPRCYGVPEGLGGTHVYQVFEDSSGRLWIATRDPEGNAVTVRDPDSGAFHRLSESDGFPPFRDRDTWANGFFEDSAGQIWVGLHRSGVIRCARGKFHTFSTADGIPPGGIRRFWEDRQGRVWLGSGHGGVARLDHPEAERPEFVIYDSTKGLSGDEIQAVAEDSWGRIYLATGSVVDRFDPATGRARRYTESEGLGSGEVQTSFRDREGNLWFGTLSGVSKLAPEADAPQDPPPIRIVRAAIGGVSRPVAEMGETGIVLGYLPARQNLELGYVGISFIPGELVRFQYRLEGGREGWSPPTEQRSVTYANLSPGRYRFSVRAIDSTGGTSASPAVAQFEVLPPVWMRWWAFSLYGVLAAFAIFTAHRYRVRQALEAEHLRARLTSDFHDEIGSGLARIAILSELARDRLSHPESAAQPLSRVAEISRELLDSLSELLWSMDPRIDRVEDLANRMRTFANEMLESRSIQLEFRGADQLEHRRIHFETRREVYLIFREAIHNIVRHAACDKVTVDLALRDSRLFLSIADNGRGLNAASDSQGRGLDNMRCRAVALGGRIAWQCDSGTTVTLEVPLRT